MPEDRFHGLAVMFSGGAGQAAQKQVEAMGQPLAELDASLADSETAPPAA
jgi:hypothetical protein